MGGRSQEEEHHGRQRLQRHYMSIQEHCRAACSRDIAIDMKDQREDAVRHEQ